MALKLTVLSEHSASLKGRGSIVFGVGGGSIGRAHDNDWVLPDPQRYLSAHHAHVKFRDGAFYLLDNSTNGVFVNDGNEPLGRRASYALRDGDRLRLGDYEISVSIDADAAETAEAPEASEIFPVHAASPGLPGGARPDLGADFSMRDLLRPNAESLEQRTLAPESGEVATTADPGLLAFDQSGRRQGPSRPLSGAARAELRASGRVADRAENASALESFCRGAGIDAKSFPDDAQARILHLAGLMMREALVGLKGLALAQRDMRDHSHIEVGREDPQQIGLTGLPVEDLLLRLLQGHDANTLDAVQWLRETLASTRRHDLAFARALRTALADYLPRLDPKVLSPGDKRAGNADVLSERFRGITEMPPGKLPHLFAEAFARVFAAEFKGSGGA